MKKVLVLSLLVFGIVAAVLPARAFDVTHTVLSGNCTLERIGVSMSQPSNLLLAPPAPQVECFVLSDRENKDEGGTITRNINQVCQLKASNGRVLAEQVHSEGYYTMTTEGAIEGFFVMAVPSQGCEATVKVQATNDTVAQ